MRENPSNRSSRVQIPRDICTRFGRYLYSTKSSWGINKGKVGPFRRLFERVSIITRVLCHEEEN